MMPGPINGELVFFLKEKTDRNKKLYLFGGIHMLNCVLFVRPEGIGSDGLVRWKATLRPYTGPGEADAEVWK